jgi:hypothetical protein
MHFGALNTDGHAAIIQERFRFTVSALCHTFTLAINLLRSVWLVNRGGKEGDIVSGSTLTCCSRRSTCSACNAAAGEALTCAFPSGTPVRRPGTTASPYGGSAKVQDRKAGADSAEDRGPVTRPLCRYFWRAYL